MTHTETAEESSVCMNNSIIMLVCWITAHYSRQESLFHKYLSQNNLYNFLLPAEARG